jgi:putative FmdB family regulatory protein
MPIYEYRCNGCGAVSSVLVRSYAPPDGVVCRRCGQANLKKLVSRVAVLRSEESRIESMADPSNLSGVDENDPRSIARWARKMGQELGEDLGDDFSAMVDRMEAGEMPDEMGGDESLDSGLE